MEDTSQHNTLTLSYDTEKSAECRTITPYKELKEVRVYRMSE